MFLHRSQVPFPVSPTCEFQLAPTSVTTGTLSGTDWQTSFDESELSTTPLLITNLGDKAASFQVSGGRASCSSTRDAPQGDTAKVIFVDMGWIQSYFNRFSSDKIPDFDPAFRLHRHALTWTRAANWGSAVIGVSSVPNHVSLVIPGDVLRSGSWNLEVPNGAWTHLNVPGKSCVGCKISRAWPSDAKARINFFVHDWSIGEVGLWP